MGTLENIKLKIKSTKQTESAINTGKSIGIRHVQAIFLFFTVTISIIMRAQLSVTLVAMTDVRNVTKVSSDTNVTYHLNATLVHNDKEINNKISEISKRTGWSVYKTYDWTKSTQDTISGSFFAGYCIMNIPMGVMSQKFGGKFPLLFAVFVNSAVSLIIPWAPIMGGWLAMCFCRLFQGMTQAALFPATHTILSKWVPLSERGRISSYVYSGTQLGTVAAFQLGGFLSGSKMFGWPTVFWGSGCLGLICFTLFFFFGYNSPDEHPGISEVEKQYIMGDINCETSKADKQKIPWKSILTSVPVWAIVITHAGSAFGFLICMIEIPVYVSKILNVDIKNNGLLSSLPYISMYACGIMFGHACDFLINRKCLSIINVRRLANTIGMAVSGLLLVAFAYAYTLPLAITFLGLSFGAHSAIHVGFYINQIDLAPNFAGTLLSIGNAVASFMGVLAPTIVALIVKDPTDQSQWQIVFLITAAAMFVSNTVYVIFLKTDLQPWNNSVHSIKQDCKYEKIDRIIYSTPDHEFSKSKEEETKV